MKTREIENDSRGIPVGPTDFGHPTATGTGDAVCAAIGNRKAHSFLSEVNAKSTVAPLPIPRFESDVHGRTGGPSAAARIPRAWRSQSTRVVGARPEPRPFVPTRHGDLRATSCGRVRRAVVRVKRI